MNGGAIVLIVLITALLSVVVSVPLGMLIERDRAARPARHTMSWRDRRRARRARAALREALDRGRS